jgi:hypothetical protein
MYGSEIKVSRRDFTKTCLAFLAGAVIDEALPGQKASAAIAAEHEKYAPFCFTASAEGVLVGREPKTVLQLEPKKGKMPVCVDFLVAAEASADRVLLWNLEEQRMRCSRTAATLTGFYPEDDSPDCYAWKDGVVRTPGITIMTWALNQRAFFRWVPCPGSEVAFHHPFYLGLVCRVAHEAAGDLGNDLKVPVSASLIGKNQLTPPGV